jgi:hypothetical protein
METPTDKLSPGADSAVLKIEHVERNLSGVQLYSANGKHRNIPVPSADPQDPLNMRPHRQRLLLAALCIFAATGFGVIQTTPLFFGNLVQEYMVQSKGVSQCLSKRPSERFTQHANRDRLYRPLILLGL